MIRGRTFSCPVELTLDVLGGKWKSIVLAHLKEGPLRYRELRLRVPRLSDKVLVQRLTELEQLGLVARRKQGRRGAPSSYALTARGATLGPALQALYDWGAAMAPELGAIVAPPLSAAARGAPPARPASPRARRSA